jgi:uncharacterized protein YfaP (DUF2135 family)
MKIKNLFTIAFIALIGFGCAEEEVGETLIGQPGNPRFNLKFDNEENVDLDLYVETPNGVTIYYANARADKGELDVDCECDECPQGPNENIFWKEGTAPEGVYKYWVEYYGSCTSGGSSNFTVKVARNQQVLETNTGSLTSGRSTKWSFTHNN